MLERTFKLSVNCSEVITTIHGESDNHGKLINKEQFVFSDEIELIRKWVDIRKTQVQERIDYLLTQLKIDYFKSQSTALIMFNQIITNKINITKELDLDKQISAINEVNHFGYDESLTSPKAVTLQKQLKALHCFDLEYLYGFSHEDNHDYNYILDKKIKDFSIKAIERQIKLMNDIAQELDKLSHSTPSDLIIEELDAISNNI